MKNGEMFGLPIPEGMRMLGQGVGWSVNGAGPEKEREEVVKEVGGTLLNEEEGERARAGLMAVEGIVLDCVARGESLANWLAEVSRVVFFSFSFVRSVLRLS